MLIFFNKQRAAILTKMYCLSICVLLAALSAGCGGAQKNLPKIIFPSEGYSVTDATGTILTFSEKPKRIVSMTISTDDILVDLVDANRITAVSWLADNPEISNIVDRIEKIPKRAYGNTPEELMAMQPDLIIVADFVKPEVIQTLRDLQLNVYVYRTPNSIKEIKNTITEMGILVGEPEKAEQLIANMDARLTAIRNKLGNINDKNRKSVIYLRSNGAYYSPENAFSDICRYAEVEDAIQRLHYASAGFVSQEEIVRLDPDIFVIVFWNYDGKHDPERIKEDILNNPSYQTIKAVKNKQVIILPGKHILALSYYTIEAIEDLARAVYPERFREDKLQ